MGLSPSLLPGRSCVPTARFHPIEAGKAPRVQNVRKHSLLGSFAHPSLSPAPSHPFLKGRARGSVEEGYGGPYKGIRLV